MKFSIAPDSFLRSLEVSALVATPRSPTVGGSSIIISTKDSALEQTAVCGGMSIQHLVDAGIDEPGEIGVDLELLMADVLSMRSTISAKTTKTSLRLEAGASKRVRPLISMDNFTEAPDIQGDLVTLDPMEFLKAVRSTRFSIIKDASRPELQCIRLGTDMVLGGDGQRVASYAFDAGVSVSIPSRALDALEALLSISSSDVSLRSNGRWLSLSGPTFVFKCALLGEDYPNAKQVVDVLSKREPVVTLTLDVPICQQIIESAKIYSSRAKRYGVEYSVIDLTEGVPKIYLDVPDVGRFEDVLEGKIEGVLQEVLYVSPNGISDALSQVGGQTAVVQIFSSQDPMVIRDPTNGRWMAIQTTMAIENSSIQVENEEDDF